MADTYQTLIFYFKNVRPICRLTITALSLLCSVIPVTTWFVIPRWRTTHNFISVNQITAGALHLAVEILTDYDIFNIGRIAFLGTLVEKLEEYLFMLSLCWSLCGQLHAYTRLVLVLPGPDHTDDRRWALLFSFGTLAMIKCITDLVVPFVFNYNIFFHRNGDNIGVTCARPMLIILTCLIVLTLNLLLYFNIARGLVSRGGVRGVGRGRGRRLVGLLGVTILSDLIALLKPTVELSAFVFELGLIKKNVENYYRILIILFTFRFLFEIRLVIQTIVVLFNVRSRQEFARYFGLRRYRQLNRVV